MLTILYNLYLFNLFLQIEDTKLILSAGQRSYAGVLPLDETVSLNTRMVFIYSHGVNVTLRTSGNHSIQITENTELQYIRAFVEESLVSNQKQYKNRDTLLLLKHLKCNFFKTKWHILESWVGLFCRNSQCSLSTPSFLNYDHKRCAVYYILNYHLLLPVFLAERINTFLHIHSRHRIKKVFYL